jgi:hypothetical protein
MRRPRRHPAVSCPTTKISVWVSAADWAWLQTRHRFDASRVVRELIGDYCRRTQNPQAPHADDWDPADLANL